MTWTTEAKEALLMEYEDYFEDYVFFGPDGYTDKEADELKAHLESEKRRDAR